MTITMIDGVVDSVTHETTIHNSFYLGGGALCALQTSTKHTLIKNGSICVKNMQMQLMLCISQQQQQNSKM